MNETDLVKGAIKIEQFVSGALDGQIKSMLTKKAVVAGACMAIPLWGIETVLYAVCLWSSYSNISTISGVPFKDHFVKNVLGGMALNIAITFGLCFLLDFIPVAGWICSFVVGFISIYLCGMGYVKTLKFIHGNKAKSDLNISRGIASLKNGDSTFKSDLSNAINSGSKIEDTINRFLQ